MRTSRIGTWIPLIILLASARAEAQYGPAPPGAPPPEPIPLPVPQPGPYERQVPPEVLELKAPKDTSRKVEPPTRTREGPNHVTVYRDDLGFKLQVDGKDIMVFGMNWEYQPIGTNYNYNFWDKSDEFIRNALDPEMRLLKEMGINVVRQYVGVPSRWIRYIYETYGIYTVLNHPMGRYGNFIDGSYVSPINYQNPRHREVLKEEILQMVEEFKGTPGLLFWLLGNENNYGLFWASAEVEALPLEQQGEARAQYLYSLFGEITEAIQEVDTNHPVAIANGDLQFIDLIAEYCPTLDILGANVYRGLSSRDLFDVVSEKLDVPFVYTEFGSDAYNARTNEEDDVAQARYLRSLWQEIYEHAYGQGRAQNAIGGMIFQWSDGWWKTGQTVNLDVHDTTASWPNSAYEFDYVEGENNMNEEWFGITAKGQPDEDGYYDVYPRTSYYLLKEGFKLDPYKMSSVAETRDAWSRLDPDDYAQNYEVSRIGRFMKEFQVVQTVGLRMEFSTFVTDGKGLVDEIQNADFEFVPTTFNEPQFDHLESFYFDLGVQPTSNVSGRLSINALGNIPLNPINPIFYENRGAEDPDELDRFQVYQAEFEWDSSYFNLEGFFRTSHYHWGYEGDFFGIYREANHPSIPFIFVEGVDTFNADAPNGVVFTGKKIFDGFKVAVGPELYWGANPGVFVKYYKRFGFLGGKLGVGAVHQEDFAQQLTNAGTSSVIPLPQTRKSTLSFEYDYGSWDIKVGGIIAGTDRLGRDFTVVRDAEGPGNGFADSGLDVFDDTIKFVDTLGAKAKIVYAGAPVGFYVHGAYKGLVADGFGDNTDTLGLGESGTSWGGWTLEEVGQGNHWSVGGGLTYRFRNITIAPNVLYQLPLEGPIPTLDTLVDQDAGNVFSGLTPRNQLDDPFWVRDNREMLGGELMIAFDPTPATWLWTWDADKRENAKVAGQLNFIYRHLPTSQDSGVSVLPDGVPFAFGGAPPAQDLFEIRAKIISVPGPDLRMVATMYGGTVQSTGVDPRLIQRGGIDLRAVYRRFDLQTYAKVNDWGPYDFQRDFNLTFPLQLGYRASYGARMPDWFNAVYTQFGAQFLYRTVDEFSGISVVTFDEGGVPSASGNQWEFSTFVHIAI
ncbi:MAG: hypothetical protein ACFB9M_02835 [Myxococcota bacterium]